MCLVCTLVHGVHLAHLSIINIFNALAWLNLKTNTLPVCKVLYSRYTYPCVIYSWDKEFYTVNKTIIYFHNSYRLYFVKYIRISILKCTSTIWQCIAEYVHFGRWFLLISLRLEVNISLSNECSISRCSSECTLQLQLITMARNWFRLRCCSHRNHPPSTTWIHSVCWVCNVGWIIIVAKWEWESSIIYEQRTLKHCLKKRTLFKTKCYLRVLSKLLTLICM